MTAALLLGMLAGTGMLLVAVSLRSPTTRALPLARSSADITIGRGQHGRGYGGVRQAGEVPGTCAGNTKLGSEIRGKRGRGALSDVVGRNPGLQRTVCTVALHASESEKVASFLGSSLAITGTSIEALCIESIASALAGFVIMPVVMAIVLVAGIALPLSVLLLLVVASALLGGSIPVAALLSDARQMRDLARRTVSSYIDLVVLCLAGGMGVEGALHAAADVGDNWFYARIRRTLQVANRSGGSMWKHIGELGEELDLPELVELSVVVGLASSEGARIRTTLSTKAASMRKRELAEAETRANRATERLFLPSMLLLLGFLIFIGYPATTRILGGI
ncbi:MAG: type II secretion system F family protein [Acidimicrobiales bacterium]